MGRPLRQVWGQGLTAPYKALLFGLPPGLAHNPSPILLLVYCCVYFWPSPRCKTSLKGGEGHAFWNQNDLGFLISNMGRVVRMFAV